MNLNKPNEIPIHVKSNHKYPTSLNIVRNSSPAIPIVKQTMDIVNKTWAGITKADTKSDIF